MPILRHISRSFVIILCRIIFLPEPNFNLQYQKLQTSRAGKGESIELFFWRIEISWLIASRRNRIIDLLMKSRQSNISPHSKNSQDARTVVTPPFSKNRLVYQSARYATLYDEVVAFEYASLLYLLT